MKSKKKLSGTESIKEFNDRLLIFSNAFLVGLIKENDKEVKIEVKKGEILKCSKFDAVFVSSYPYGHLFSGSFGVYEWIQTVPKTRKIIYFDCIAMRKNEHK